MNKSTRYITLGAIVVILVGLFVWYKATPGKYDALANYLTQSGVKFYGAYWCPHCQATKQAFGKSAKKLPYIECSLPDGQSQTQVCIDAKVQTYPTWDFPNPIILSSGTNDSNVACSSDTNKPQACLGAAAGSYVLIVNNRAYLTPSSATLQNGIWTLPAHSRTSGEVSPEDIGKLAGYKGT